MGSASGWAGCDSVQPAAIRHDVFSFHPGVFGENRVREVSYQAAVALLFASYFVGYCLGYQLRMIADALSAA